MSIPGSRALVCAALFALTAAPYAAQGDDKWELGGTALCVDDAASNCNQLTHGQPQTHDLQGAVGADVDFMTVETRNRHSYEVRAFNSNQPWTAPGTINTTKVDRVNAAGTVLTAGFAPDGTGATGIVANWNAVRWIGTANQRDFIRVVSNLEFASNANDQYDIELLDTTYFVPRWNSSGGQVTVMLIQNTQSVAVTGSVFFYSNAGALLHTEPLNVPVNALQVINTGSIPALAGSSGHAHIAHLGGWGALSTKAVALEPATGFSFDTVGAPIPR
jgi:hypothetical protein